MARRPRHQVIGAIAAVVVLGAAAIGVGVARRQPGLPKGVVDAYLGAWARNDAAGMARRVERPTPALAAAVAQQHDALAVRSAEIKRVGVRRAGGGADATYQATLQLTGLGPFRYTGRLHLERADSRWRVRWTPSALHPALVSGGRFVRLRTFGPRAPITGAGGADLASTGDVVHVGIEPDHVTDLSAVQAALAANAGVDPMAVAKALARPGTKPNAFVPIATLPEDRYQQVKPMLAPVPGIVFQRTVGRVGAPGAPAVHVVGRTGEVTADGLRALGPTYQAGDTVGRSGLEAAFERQLAGDPSGTVQVLDAAGTPTTLQRFDGAAGRPVATTLDVAVQRAAEHALDGVAQPAALVAVDAASGDIRAVVSRPADQEFNRALAGRYPPGSTFKVVTSAALLAAGTLPTTTVPCPPKAVVGGRAFTNFEGEGPGTLTFSDAFALSCNTAFVTLSAQLSKAALQSSARDFGFDLPYHLPLPAAGGRFPAPADAAEQAAASIGQGRVEASPLQMATVAAAVAGGSWRAPRLLQSDPPGATHALDPPVVQALRTLMVGVVQHGTGTAAAVAGPPVAGKTGTAEFGASTPPTTHAWFIGFRGTLAFAVLVEGGGVGGRVAAPLAARFLTQVPAA